MNNVKINTNRPNIKKYGKLSLKYSFTIPKTVFKSIFFSIDADMVADADDPGDTNVLEAIIIYNNYILSFTHMLHIQINSINSQ